MRERRIVKKRRRRRVDGKTCCVVGFSREVAYYSHDCLYWPKRDRKRLPLGPRSLFILHFLSSLSSFSLGRGSPGMSGAYSQVGTGKQEFERWLLNEKNPGSKHTQLPWLFLLMSNFLKLCEMRKKWCDLPVIVRRSPMTEMRDDSAERNAIKQWKSEPHFFSTKVSIFPSQNNEK